MVSPLTDKIYDLNMPHAISLDRARDRTIRCVETHLWVTEQGWSDDIIVAPGESHAIRSNGRVVIATLGRCSRFSISVRPRWFARLLGYLVPKKRADKNAGVCNARCLSR